MVTYPVADIRQRMCSTFFHLAGASVPLDVDFHVGRDDGSRRSETLRIIAEVRRGNRLGPAPSPWAIAAPFQLRMRRVRIDTLDMVAKTGLNIVSLPMCNLYLQDRHSGPHAARNRGITLGPRDEAERGINVSLCQLTTPAIHFTPMATWTCWKSCAKPPASVISTTRNLNWTKRFFRRIPARACGIDAAFACARRAVADLVIFKARRLDRSCSPGPQSDRIVIRAGEAIDTSPARIRRPRPR